MDYAPLSYNRKRKALVDPSGVRLNMQAGVPNAAVHTREPGAGIEVTGGPVEGEYGIFDNGMEVGQVTTNGLKVMPAAASSNPYIKATGVDTNVSLGLATQGTGYVGIDALKTNYIKATGAADTFNPSLEAAGGSATVDLELKAKGTTGAIKLGTSKVAYVAVSGNTTGLDPVVKGQGETNTGLELQTSGTGSVKLDSGKTAYVSVTGSAASDPVIAVVGADKNLRIQAGATQGIWMDAAKTNFVKIGGSVGFPIFQGRNAAGSGNVTLNVCGQGTGGLALDAVNTNYVTVNGAASGPVTIGTNSASADLYLSPPTTGRVYPKRWSCVRRYTAAQDVASTTLDAASSTIVQWPVAVWDPNSAYAGSATYGIVVPVTGVYNVKATVGVLAGAQNVVLYITVGGTAVYSQAFAGAAGINNTYTMTQNLSLSATNNVAIRIAQNGLAGTGTLVAPDQVGTLAAANEFAIRFVSL